MKLLGLVILIGSTATTGCWFDNDFGSFRVGGSGGSGGQNQDGSAGADGASPDAPLPKMPSFIQPPKRFFTQGGQTAGVTVADLNGDGLPDVAAFKPTANSGLVTSFISDGNGDFPTIVDGVPSGSTAVAIASGLIGTTIMGAVTTNSDGNVSIYHAGSTGLLTYETSYYIASQTSAVGQAAAMAPLDGGAKSWLIEGTDKGLSISAPAAGTNYTAPGSQYLMGVSIKAVSVGHFKGPSALDIVAVGDEASSGRAYVLLNNGSGALALPQILPVSSSPTAVATGDVDGGGVDIVVATSNKVEIFLNTGSGTFSSTPAHTYNAQATVTALALADFNGDSKIDLAVVSNGADIVSVFTGNGDSSFNPPAIFAGGQLIYGIGVADFNRDNKPDIVVSGFVGIYVLQNSTQ